MATYRDPDPARSLGALREALEASAKESLGEEELEKAIIGTYSKETRPRTSADKGMADFMRLLCGMDDAMRQRKLEAIIDMDSQSLGNAAACRLSEAAQRATAVVVAGESAAVKAAELLRVVPQLLPS
ncbi:hypothetical protein MASR2M78_16840 [Treponema sp.]